MRRVIALVLALAAVSSVSLPGQEADPLLSAEFPPQDDSLIFPVTRGIAKVEAAELLQRDPATVETVQACLAAGDIPGLLRSLRAVVDRRPERIADAFDLLRSEPLLLRNQPLLELMGDTDLERGYKETLQQIFTDAQAALASRSREDQARVARVQLGLDRQITRDLRVHAESLRRFIGTYRGTQAALLAEIDAIALTPGPQQLAPLDAFIQQHPGTLAAAKALYQKGLQLGSGYLADDDPIERFRRTQDVVRELESGRYPASEWVSKAPSLIVRFFVSDRMQMAPESVDEMIAAYTEFAAGHFVLSERAPDRDGVGYVVTTRIGDLFARKGERVAGVERTLDALEQRVSDPGAVRLLRGLFYLRPGRDDTAAERAIQLEKARRVLGVLAAEGQALNHRRALATLAALEFAEGRYAEALPLLRQYAAAYPSSPWTWIARLRIGQAQEAQGELTAAVESYLDAARTHAELPIARVLGAAYAARALEFSGNPTGALEQYQRALAGWDVNYGLSYTTNLRRTPVPGDPTPVDAGLVVKETLAPRIAELTRSAAVAGGTMLERARALVVREQWEEASQELARMLAEHPASSLAAEARNLMHRAQIEAALDIADVNRPNPDLVTAMNRVDAISREANGFGVVAANIARSTFLLKQGKRDEAATTIDAALSEWYERQPAFVPASPLEEDVTAIRQMLFLPRGGGVYGAFRDREVFSEPARPFPFLLMNAEVPVTLHDGETSRVRAAGPLGGAGRIVFFDTDQIALLETILVKLGGRPPRPFREVSNQPIGDAMAILALWTRFFPARQGPGGWELEAYPRITHIRFANAERTKASASVTIGFQGGTVELEKEGGKWVARRLTNRSIV